MIPSFSLLAIAAYLLGSVSSAILLCKIVYHQDIRDHGSRNPGANNVQRVFGWKAGISVFLFDFMKGVGAVSLVYLAPVSHNSEAFVQWQIVFGLCAFIGHLFPLFFQFRGGKGVAVLAGAMFAIHPWGALMSIILFGVMLGITRYTSVSVLCAAASYPLFVNLLFGLWLDPQIPYTIRIFSVVVALMLPLTHISNIKRLLQGKEKKFALKKPVRKV